MQAARRKSGRTRSKSRSAIVPPKEAEGEPSDSSEERMANAANRAAPAPARVPTLCPEDQAQFSAMVGDQSVSADAVATWLDQKGEPASSTFILRARGDLGRRLLDLGSAARVSSGLRQELRTRANPLLPEVVAVIEQRLTCWIYNELSQQRLPMTPDRWIGLLKQVRVVVVERLGKAGEAVAESIDATVDAIALRRCRFIGSSTLAERMRGALAGHRQVMNADEPYGGSDRLSDFGIG